MGELQIDHSGPLVGGIPRGGRAGFALVVERGCGMWDGGKGDVGWSGLVGKEEEAHG